MELTKIFEFDAAHQLPNYDGKCANLHGHRWKLEVTIEGEPDTKSGMIVDFKDLKKIVNDQVIEVLDHHCLNDLIENPTAEEIIRWIWTKLIASGDLKRLRLWESATSHVTLEK
jgi:6-pyruvoyltetrahydropterin/6-carboxytetrahydropterin synthase